MNHRWEIDALRGLMLVLMTLTHLPTRFSDPFGQPFGFVSAAEGFVMLSGYMAGMVYTMRQQRQGDAAMQEAFLARAFKIYLCQAGLLLFVFTVIALIGFLNDEDAVKNLLAFYRERPLPALLGAALLLYNPPLLDILPMYIVFMLVSPVLLLHGSRQGWGVVFVLSVALWVGAQFGLARLLHASVIEAIGLPVPFEQVGAFDIFAWQLLWVLGLWLGSTHAAAGERAEPTRFPGWMVAVALIYAGVCMAWRHIVGQAPFPPETGLNLLFDKWKLAPLRLINFFALLLLVMHFSGWLKQHLPRSRVLEMLGAAALPVFCAHLVLVMLLLATIGGAHEQRPLAIDVLAVLGSLAVLVLVARISAAIDERTAEMRARLREASQRRQLARRQRRRDRQPAVSGR